MSNWLKAPGHTTGLEPEPEGGAEAVVPWVVVLEVLVELLGDVEVDVDVEADVDVVLSHPLQVLSH